MPMSPPVLVLGPSEPPSLSACNPSVLVSELSQLCCVRVTGADGTAPGSMGLGSATFSRRPELCC
jgi:hypothetical protein